MTNGTNGINDIYIGKEANELLNYYAPPTTIQEVRRRQDLLRWQLRALESALNRTDPFSDEFTDLLKQMDTTRSQLHALLYSQYS